MIRFINALFTMIKTRYSPLKGSHLATFKGNIGFHELVIWLSKLHEQNKHIGKLWIIIDCTKAKLDLDPNTEVKRISEEIYTMLDRYYSLKTAFVSSDNENKSIIDFFSMITINFPNYDFKSLQTVVEAEMWLQNDNVIV